MSSLNSTTSSPTPQPLRPTLFSTIFSCLMPGLSICRWICCQLKWSLAAALDERIRLYTTRSNYSRCEGRKNVSEIDAKGIVYMWFSWLVFQHFIFKSGGDSKFVADKARHSNVNQSYEFRTPSAERHYIVSVLKTHRAWQTSREMTEFPFLQRSRGFVHFVPDPGFRGLNEIPGRVPDLWPCWTMLDDSRSHHIVQ